MTPCVYRTALLCLFVVCFANVATGANCRFPGQPANARMWPMQSVYEPGSALYFDCEPGYELSGHTRRTCYRYGVWSGANPVCLPNPPACRQPKPTSTKALMFPEKEFFDPGEVLRFICSEPDERLQGPSSITCQKDFSWSDPVPQCVPTEG